MTYNLTDIIKYNLDGSIKPSKEWAISTEGSNLLEILTTEHVTTLVCAKDSVSKAYEPESKELLYREKDKSKNTFSTNDVDVILS